MAEQFENNYTTILNGAIDDNDTTITVDAAPVNMTGTFRIKIDNEIILVGAVSGLTFTGCTRGVEDTTPASHSDNATVTHVLTAESLLNAGKREIDYLEAVEASAPSTPASGKVRIYAKTDGRIYSKDDAGTEYGPFDASGGGSPLLYVDSLTLHADGDDFSSMSAWTAGGSPSSSAVTTEEYDSTCYDLTFPSQGARYYKAVHADFLDGSKAYVLTVHELNNNSSDPHGAAGGMLALMVVNDSGTGTGWSLYNNNSSCYMWGVSSNNYNSSGNEFMNNSASFVLNNKIPMVMRLSKSGSTITGALSLDGGVTYPYSQTRSDSTTFTRIQIGRLYTNGGTNPRMRVGRLNLI